MAITINTNVASLNAQRNLNHAASGLNEALQRLSSGRRINSAKDDAAGLSISSRFTSQIRGLNQAIRNGNDGISLTQTAEGALQQTTDLLQRIRELAIQSANDTNSASDRQSIQDEVEQLKSEINRIASTTEFNGRKLLDGTAQNLTFHVGSRASQTITFNVRAASADDLGNHSLDAATSTANQGTGSATAAGANAAATNTVATQTLTISGSEGSSDVAITAGDTAEAIAKAINDVTASTGVSATAKNVVTLDSLSNDGTVSFTLGSGTSNAAVSATVTTTDLSNLATEINKVSGTTGVSAAVNNGEITLTQVEGKDIIIEDFTHSIGGNAETISVTGGGGGNATVLTTGGNDSTRVAGTLKFDSTSSFSARSSVAEANGSVLAEANANDLAFSAITLVSSLDITSQQGANDALDVIDAAIASVDSIRSEIGAIQNRFEVTIANLGNVVENASAARSRIMDADFAAETAALTKAQILQQAGAAVLSQANQIPALALSLLQ